MDTTELVSWFRMAQIDPYFGTAIQGRFEQAADTIDRLENELRAVKAAYEAEPGPLDEARVEFERYANFCCGHEE